MRIDGPGVLTVNAVLIVADLENRIADAVIDLERLRERIAVRRIVDEFVQRMPLRLLLTL